MADQYSAYWEGYVAYRDGVKVNPYPPNSRYAKQWNEGWRFANWERYTGNG